MKKTVIFKKWKLYAILKNGFFVLTPFTLYSRIYLNYHTLEQVIFLCFKRDIFLDCIWINFWE